MTPPRRQALIKRSPPIPGTPSFSGTVTVQSRPAVPSASGDELDEGDRYFDARDDRDAINQCLGELCRSPRSRKEYEREATRLLLWMHSCQRTLATMTFKAFKAYYDQLQDESILQRHIERFVPVHERRAFEEAFAVGDYIAKTRRGARKQGLTESQEALARLGYRRALRARTILQSIINALGEKQYLVAVSLPKVLPPGDVVQPAVRDRAAELRARKLPPTEWAKLDAYVEQLDWRVPAEALQRVIYVWLRDSGARRMAIVAAKLNRLNPSKDEPNQFRRLESGQWVWDSVKKGGGHTTVLVTDAMLHAWKRYRNGLGFPVEAEDPFLVNAKSTHVFRALPSKRNRSVEGEGVSESFVYRSIKAIVKGAGLDSNIAARRLSPHWLRHERAIELNEEFGIADVAKFLGHASVTTTQIYATEGEQTLFEKLAAAPPSRRVQR